MSLIVCIYELVAASHQLCPWFPRGLRNRTLAPFHKVLFSRAFGRSVIQYPVYDLFVSR